MCILSKCYNITNLSSAWGLEMDETKKARLADSFGEAAARIIIEHERDLDEIFGSAAPTIKRVMDGELERD